MRKTAATVLVGLVAIVTMAQPAQAKAIRIGYGADERVEVAHEGDFCWKLHVRPNGRMRGTVIDGTRAERGAPCRGDVILRVIFPRGAREDQTRVIQIEGVVYAFALRY